MELQEAGELDTTIHLGGGEEMLKGKLQPRKHSPLPHLGLSRRVAYRGAHRGAHRGTHRGAHRGAHRGGP